MNEKKVVVVIVEGQSDENALGGILKEYFSSEEVQFAVVHGDITSDVETSLDESSPNYIIKRVEKLISEVRVKYGYEWEDFLRIIHISDTDGAFTKNCIVKEETNSVMYFEDHIVASNVKKVEHRNKHKSAIMSKLYSSGKIHMICYRLFFNSCNLEHVLYNELKDFSDEEKEILSDEFAERFEGRVQEFIDFISDESVAVQGKYKETWRYIEKDRNSLHRCSNMHLIFE